MAKNLLIELGTEELPPKSLKSLSNSFTASIVSSLKDAGLNYSASKSFATPRRLALILEGLDEKQQDRVEEKLGPNVKAAFDGDGKPTKAALGFAASCGVEFDQVGTSDTDKGERLSFTQNISGKQTADLIAAIIENALQQLPIAKRMRWGSSRAEFVRPVKWLGLVFGDDVIEANILNVAAGNTTRGHRFHSQGEFVVNSDNYEQLLEQQHVIADYDRRQQMISEQIATEAKTVSGNAQVSQDLLDEVTALVEWPVALLGNFEARFLDVPAEALISSMVEHQKYFHLFDGNGALMPHFITISNIASSNPSQVIDGNERVIRPRLSDAVFFFETDKKQSLESRLPALEKIVFQKDLGSVAAKSQRISALAGIIAEQIGSNSENAKRAGLLAKTDLVSEMVLEFASLQGLMGMHYATNDGEASEVATAIYEQYLPKGAGGELPSSLTGAAVSLADRIDTLIGIFGIGQSPTGNKDPFALRRQALAILNIIVGKGLDIDLAELYKKAFALYDVTLADNTVSLALDYTIERFKAHYQNQDIATEVYLAVANRKPTKPLDFDARVKAVANFNTLDSASALAAANKRVANILAKQDGEPSDNIDESLLNEAAEKTLFAALNTQQASVASLKADNNYSGILESLAELKEPIDAFFEDVMVMADDEALKNNRIALLAKLRALFLLVADISLLVTK